LPSEHRKLEVPQSCTGVEFDAFPRRHVEPEFGVPKIGCRKALFWVPSNQRRDGDEPLQAGSPFASPNAGEKSKAARHNAWATLNPRAAWEDSPSRVANLWSMDPIWMANLFACVIADLRVSFYQS
jgi:hypothetical protein